MGLQRPWLTVTVGTLWFLRSAVAAPVLPATYKLNGHGVHLPSAAAHYPGPEGLFVTATRESLASALVTAGWSPNDRPLEGAWVFAQPTSDHRTTAALGDRVLAWPLAKNIDGPGSIWFVRLVHLLPGADKPTGEGKLAMGLRPDADLALKAVFLTGTSRLAAAVPATPNGKRLSWVRLRHAAGELRLDLAPNEDGAATEGGDAQGAEPPGAVASQADFPTGPAALNRPDKEQAAAACVDKEADAPAKDSYQPNPEVGAMCEAHGNLPLHPLAANKIANSVVWHSAPLTKQVALTFDACSTFAIGRFNPRVIATLRAEKVPATLFVGGHWAEMYPDVLEDLAQDPLFEIGNHTYSHPHMRDLSPQTQRQELLWTQDLIFQRTGKVPKLFRPPYGEVDDTLITTAGQSGLYTVEYDLPAGDADDHVTKLHLTNWVVGHSNPGSIVVMHMCRPNNHTADALPPIVRSLRQQGYKFCQVSDMLFNGGKQCQ